MSTEDEQEKGPEAHGIKTMPIPGQPETYNRIGAEDGETVRPTPTHPTLRRMPIPKKVKPPHVIHHGS